MTAFMLRWTKDWVSVALMAVPFLAGDAVAAPAPPVPPLQLKSIADIPLGGHSTRLDYASLDAGRHLLFIAHLGDSEVIVFDTEARRVVKRIASAARNARVSTAINNQGQPDIPTRNQRCADAHHLEGCQGTYVRRPR